jgi:hypothetical protein
MKIPLSIRFFLWIIGGFIILSILSILTWRSICSTLEYGDNPTQSPIEYDNRTGNLHHLIDHSALRAVTNAKGNDKDAATQTSETKQNPRLVTVICDAKITDLGLVYFTYCLVIVGWFAIQSDRHKSEAIERAYVFPGYSQVHFRNRRVTFTLKMTNAGRSPGVIKEIGYVFLEGVNLPRSRRDADWTWETMEWDWVIPVDGRRDIKKLQSLAGEHTFVSYIKYQDMFTKKRHTSWMSMYNYPDRPPNERSVRAGGEVWNEWD